MGLDHSNTNTNKTFIPVHETKKRNFLTFNRPLNIMNILDWVEVEIFVDKIADFEFSSVALYVSLKK